LRETVEASAPAAAGITQVHVGIVAIPIATILALNLLPDKNPVEGALFWPAWIMTAGLLSGAVSDMFHGGISTLLRVQHIVMFGLVMIGYAELLQPSYSTPLEPDIIRQTFIAIGLFGTALSIGCSLSPPNLPRTLDNFASRSYSRETVFRILLACWITGMFYYVYISDFSLTRIVTGLLAERFSSPWTRGQLGDWNAFIDFLSNFGFIVAPFTVALALLFKSWWRLPVLAGIICSLVFFAFILQAGGRRQVVAVIGASAMTWFCARIRALRFKHYAAGALLILCTAVLIEVVLAARSIGFGGYDYNGTNLSEIHIDNNFLTLGETLKAIPTNHDFVGFADLWYVIVRPIPRVFWPEKPVNSGFDLADYLGYRDVSLSMTAVGEAYMSFGWIGIAVGGFVFGVLARFWVQLIDRDYGVMGSVLYSLGAMTLMIGMRSFSELVVMAYPIFCWYFFDRVFGGPPARVSVRWNG
jgi:oligosaccharide repeat unit polymerase